MKQRDSLQWECWDGRQTGCPPGRLQAVSAGPQSPHRAEKQETGVPDQGFPAKPEPLEESSSLGGRSRAASTHTGAATRSCFQAQAGVGGRSRAASAHTGAATRSCFQAQAGVGGRSRAASWWGYSHPLSPCWHASDLLPPVSSRGRPSVCVCVLISSCKHTSHTGSGPTLRESVLTKSLPQKPLSPNSITF